MRHLRHLLAPLAALLASPAVAQVLIFNSPVPATNKATRADWLAATGIVTPEYLVDFESGFTDNENISGVSGLFPAGFVITDTSGANAAIIKSGAGSIKGSNPVGNFAVTQNELPYLRLDFTAFPVDYVAFQDIDTAGTTGIVELEGGATVNVSFGTTPGTGDSAEFLGFFRNDQPRITAILLDASGDGLWGIDNIEYGRAAPEPGTCALFAAGVLTFAGFVRRRNSPPA
jgi:hypothetical protein